ncbi:MAG: hypothetical protein ABFD90_18935 [Phycisphaerales bacterium]
MRSSRAVGIAFVVVAAVLPLLAGCTIRRDSAGEQTDKKGPSSTAALSGTVTQEGARTARGQMGTRELSATATGARVFSLEVNPLTNSGVVVLNKHKLVVEGDSVLLHGKEVVKLSPQSKKVEITYKSGRVTISDGVNPAQSLRL